MSVLIFRDEKSTYMTDTAYKESLFGVILVRIFPAYSRIPNVGKCVKNADQNKSEYGHFLRSVKSLIESCPVRTGCSSKN